MLLEGKKGLIIGLSNKRSIAWGVTQACKNHGARLCITYQNEAMEKRARPLSDEVGAEMFIQCDAQKDNEVENVFKAIKEKWGKFDFIVHSIAYAPGAALKGRFHETIQSDFSLAMDISVYSLIKFVSGAVPLLNEGGSIITMTYYGSQKVVPNYKLMGVCKAALEATVRELAVDLGREEKIRVNAISAGAIRTLASSGISGFSDLQKSCESRTPTGQLCTPDNVGDSAVYLLSDLASAVTGEVHYVDGGFNATV